MIKWYICLQITTITTIKTHRHTQMTANKISPIMANNNAYSSTKNLNLNLIMIMDKTKANNSHKMP